MATIQTLRTHCLRAESLRAYSLAIAFAFTGVTSVAYAEGDVLEGGEKLQPAKVELEIPAVVIQVPKLEIKYDLDLGPLPLGEVEPDESVIAVDPSLVNHFHKRS